MSLLTRHLENKDAWYVKELRSAFIITSISLQIAFFLSSVLLLLGSRLNMIGNWILLIVMALFSVLLIMAGFYLFTRIHNKRIYGIATLIVGTLDILVVLAFLLIGFNSFQY